MTIILLEYRDIFEYCNIELAILWQYNNETAILYCNQYYCNNYNINNPRRRYALTPLPLVLPAF
jgi:hypothetical protein